MKTICRSCREALRIINRAEEYGASDEILMDAYQYLINNHDLQNVPAWIMREAETLIASGACRQAAS
jgi:hypothetical protein